MLQRTLRLNLFQTQRIIVQNCGTITATNRKTEKLNTNLVKVFYDGKCGLCSKEISYYKNISPNGIFDWQDITEIPSKELKSEGLSLAEGLRLLHAKGLLN